MAGTRGFRAGRGVISLALDQSQFDKGIRGTQNSLKNMRRTFRSLSFGGGFGAPGGGRGGRGMFAFGGGGGLAALLTAGTAGLGASKALAAPIKLAMEYQRANAQMRAYTDTADQLMVKLLELSKVSIVSFESLQQGANTLLGYGLAANKVMETLTAMTNIAAGSTDQFNRLNLALGQVVSKGRLYAAETRQFVEAKANPLQLIAEQVFGRARAPSMTTFMLEAQESGRISAEQVRVALINATKEGGRFHNMLSKIASTSAGRMAQSMAEWRRAMIELGQELLPVVNTLLRELLGLAESLRRFFTDNSKAAFAFAKGMLAVSGAAAGLIATIGAGGLLKLLLGTAAGLTIGPLMGVMRLFTSLTSLMGGLAASSAALMGVVGGRLASMMTGPLGLLSMAAPMIGRLMGAIGFAGNMLAALSPFLVMAAPLLAAVGALRLLISGFRQLPAALEWFRELGRAVHGFAMTLLRTLIPVWESFVMAIRGRDLTTAIRVGLVGLEVAFLRSTQNIRQMFWDLADSIVSIFARIGNQLAAIAGSWGVSRLLGLTDSERAALSRGFGLPNLQMTPFDRQREQMHLSNRERELADLRRQAQRSFALEQRRAAESRRRLQEEANRRLEVPPFLDPEEQEKRTKRAQRAGGSAVQAGAISRMLTRAIGPSGIEPIVEKQLDETRRIRRSVENIEDDVAGLGGLEAAPG